MTDTVIHVLETVEIEKQQSNILIVAFRMGHCLFQAIMKQQAVWQAGEYVVVGQLIYIFLGIPVFKLTTDTIRKTCSMA